MRHHSRDSFSALRIRPRPLSPPFDMSHRPSRGLRLSPRRDCPTPRAGSPGLSRARSPRAWPSAFGDRGSRASRVWFGDSPPLRQSLDGRPRAKSAPSSPPSSSKARSRLPPGVVKFPSGNLLATASVGVTNRKDLRHKEFKWPDTPLARHGARKHSMEVLARPLLSPEDLEAIRGQFKILRMTFPVRCKFKACASIRGPCRELWTNMITVPGVLLRYMECGNCGLQFLVFPWGGSQRDNCCVQALVMSTPDDRYLLGHPRGHFSWR